MSTPRAPHVFISYAHADKPFVNRLVNDLQVRGITVWIDRSGIQPGTRDWENALRAAISKAHAVILIASEDAQKSLYVKDELRLANDVYHLPIYPLWVAGAYWINSIPLGWGGTQYIDARGDEAHYQSALRQLVATLNGQQTITSLLPVVYPTTGSSPGQTPLSRQSPVWANPSMPVYTPVPPARKSVAAPACLIATLVSLVVVGVLVFLLAGSVIGFVSNFVNKLGGSVPEATITVPPQISSGKLHVTPTSFHTTRTEGTVNGCFYFSGNGWNCSVTLQNVSDTGQLNWSTSVSPDSITLSPSAAIAPIGAGESQQVEINIPDSFSGHADVTFKGPENTVDVPIDCSC